jgi:hypothetical protein
MTALDPETVNLASTSDGAQPLHRRLSLAERRVKTGGGRSGLAVR